MSNGMHAIKFAEKVLKSGKFDSAFEAYVVLYKSLEKLIGDQEKINDTFTEIGKNYWSECGECNSHVLLDMGDCPFCGTELVEGEAPSTEAVNASPEPKEKKKSKEPVKEEVAEEPVKDEETAPEESEDEVPTEDEVNEMTKKELLEIIEEFELDVDEKIKKGRSLPKLRKAVNEAFEEGGDEEYDITQDVEMPSEEPAEPTEPEKAEEANSDDEGEEASLPSADEVDEMNKKELQEIIEEFELDVDEKIVKGRSIAKLRNAVNDAIDEAYPEDEGDENDGGEIDQEFSDTMNDLKFDDIDSLEDMNLGDFEE